MAISRGKPVTLASLMEIRQDPIFRNLCLLHDILSNGILDFLVSANSVIKFDFGQQDQNVDPLAKARSTYKLDLQTIKPSTRVTLLINYLHLVQKNNQLVLSSQNELDFMFYLFKSVVEPYESILNIWLTSGEL